MSFVFGLYFNYTANVQTISLVKKFFTIFFKKYLIFFSFFDKTKENY